MYWLVRQRAVIHARYVVMLLSLGGCASQTGSTVEKLDPLTGVTMTAATAPTVFYRDNSGRAAFARDFISLGPVQVNKSGRYRYFLWAGAWSTGQQPDEMARRDDMERLILFVDGEPVPLDLAGWTPESIGASSSMYSKPVASAVDAYYEVTIDFIRLLANASEVHLRTGGASSETYELWDDQQGAKKSLGAFLARSLE